MVVWRVSEVYVLSQEVLSREGGSKEILDSVLMRLSDVVAVVVMAWSYGVQGKVIQHLDFQCSAAAETRDVIFLIGIFVAFFASRFHVSATRISQAYTYVAGC